MTEVKQQPVIEMREAIARIVDPKGTAKWTDESWKFWKGRYTGRLPEPLAKADAIIALSPVEEIRAAAFEEAAKVADKAARLAEVKRDGWVPRSGEWMAWENHRVANTRLATAIRSLTSEASDTTDSAL
jgi:hypothetical protein